MAHQQLIIALSALIAAQSATNPYAPRNAPAPAGTPETLYCLRVGPLPGNVAETVECWTRAEWADQGVDVDKEWAKNGVRTLG
jgi:hypothetical protein